MKILLLAILTSLISTVSASENIPESISLWKKQSEHFWALNYKDEDKFKKELSSYNSRIYSGEMRKRMLKWIKEGNLESEYYSSRYSDFKDMKIGAIKKISQNKYKVKTIQSSCYSLDYNPPTISSIVADYRVTNLTQEQVSHWYRSVTHPKYPGLPTIDADVCLDIFWDMTLQTNQKNKLIEKEAWTISKSILKLRPEKAPESAAK